MVGRRGLVVLWWVELGVLGLGLLRVRRGLMRLLRRGRVGRGDGSVTAVAVAGVLRGRRETGGVRAGCVGRRLRRRVLAGVRRLGDGGRQRNRRLWGGSLLGLGGVRLGRLRPFAAGGGRSRRRVLARVLLLGMDRGRGLRRVRRRGKGPGCRRSRGQMCRREAGRRRRRSALRQVRGAVSRPARRAGPVGKRQRSPHYVLHPVPLRLVQATVAGPVGPTRRQNRTVRYLTRGGPLEPSHGTASVRSPDERTEAILSALS
ncbi:hypothetical protein GCM10018773_42320 [Streptomyces candidus]|nr:hypothetical protein GCM10018773_42320 [Streptomyces candidus]